MARVAYPPEMTRTEHGRRLYPYWRRIKLADVSPEFEDYISFYKWAIESGYSVGAKLFRDDVRLPYSPDNCFWVASRLPDGTEKLPVKDLEWEKKWDETVNQIRRHYGMKPIHSSEV